MVLPQDAALQLFVDRLTSRSIMTEKEVTAVLGLQGEIKKSLLMSTSFGLGNRSVILRS